MSNRLKMTLAFAMLGFASVGHGTAIAAAPGGSNYSWYRLNGCDREPYGVIANFHDADARAQITAQLAQMIASGQQRLRIGIFHGRGLSSGTLLDSSGGDLSPRNRDNLAALLAAVTQAGFAEIEVAFHPVGPNWAPGWPAWDEGLFQENWNLIHNLRPIIRAAGLPYRIDLHNEAIPAPSQPILLQYAQKLWANYTYVYGRDDTVGFSVIADEPARIARIPEVYGATPPYLFDVHFYGGDQQDEYRSFLAAHDAMQRVGYTQGWIIGEAYYNDPIAAGRLQTAIRDTGRTVFYLTQWPLTRARRCPDVDVPAPTAFDAYVRAGFGALPVRPPGPATPPPSGNVDQGAGAQRIAMLGMRLRGRRALVRLACRSGPSTCAGRLTLRTARRVRVGGRRRVVTLGRASYRVGAGQRRTVPVRIGPTGRRVMRRTRSLRVRVIATDRASHERVTTGGALRRR